MKPQVAKAKESTLQNKKLNKKKEMVLLPL